MKYTYIKTGREFNMLQDVISHFSKNPEELRSMDNWNTCTYLPSKTKAKSIGCAIGMYLEDNIAKELDKQDFSTITSIRNRKELCELLPKWIIAMDINFLSDIQNLHDSDDNWNLKGLSRKGRNRIKGMCKKYDLDYKQLKFK